MIMMNEDGASGATLPDSEIWMVRAGRRGVYADRFLGESIVAIGWGEIGEIDASDSKDEIRRRIDEAFPNEKPGAQAAWAGSVRRFVKEVKVGDPVVTYDNKTKLYHLGEIRSTVKRGSVTIDGEERWEFQRGVEWKSQVLRDSLLQDTQYRLGGVLAVFRVPAAASADLRKHVSNVPASSAEPQGREPQPAAESDDRATFLQEYIHESDGFIGEAIKNLDWKQIQELVAGILRAMGYKTTVSSPGRDRGVDISASPDGLGLSEPRIFVEVKHREGSIGAPDIRSFIGGRRDGDRCLYVSTGGFTQEARYEAARSQIPITLVDLPQLRELLVEYYETLDSETRALVPLKRFYLPVSLNDL